MKNKEMGQAKIIANPSFEVRLSLEMQT